MTRLRYGIHTICGCLLALFAFGSALALDLKAPPRVPLSEDGIHDPSVETIHVLQDPADSMQNFPMDRRGEVNWVKALQQGVITPRKTRTGDPRDGAPMVELDLDIIMTDTKQMPYVRFPHKAHTQWLACSNCHPDIFVPKANGNPVSMVRVLEGKFCGRCHDKVSFALWTCERCHSVPHSNSPPPWWNTQQTTSR